MSLRRGSSNDLAERGSRGSAVGESRLGPAGPDVSALALFTDPVTVTVNGVSYQMSLNVQNPPAAFDLPP